MKYLSLLVFGLWLTACSGEVSKVSDERLVLPDEISQGSLVDLENQMIVDEVLELEGERAKIALDDFAERTVINSPLTLSGQAPRNWFFEGSFPVTIMNLDETIVKEWYAEGPWLELLNGETEMAADDLIPFTATIEFEAPAPEVSDMGKIRFSKNLVADEDVPEYMEVMVLWP